jgi:hypothetical protein
MRGEMDADRKACSKHGVGGVEGTGEDFVAD